MEKTNEEMKREKQEQWYNHLIHARDFHYEQFTRWSSYFYVIIGALFVGYYNSLDHEILAWVILCIGYITSIANFLSIKGYIYWWQHWSLLLAHYEQELCQDDNDRGKVYSVFANIHELHHPCSLINGSNISTSKVALLLAGSIVLAWSVLLGVKISNCCNCGCEDDTQCYYILCSIISTILLFIIGTILIPSLPMVKSNIKYHEDLNLSIE